MNITMARTEEILWYALRPMMYGMLPDKWYQKLAHWRERRLPRTHVEGDNRIKKFKSYFIKGNHVVHSLRPCDDLNCVFVHIPKTAGTSVSHSLFGCGVGHRAVSDYKDIFGERFQRYFKFTIVRNPFSRLVSSYERSKPSTFWGGSNEESFGYDGFENLVLNGLTQLSAQDTHFRPQTEFLTINGELAVDYVARFEDLQKEFDYLCEQLGVNAELSSKDDAGDRPPLSSYYEDKEVADTVRTLYADDFSLLDYSREVPGRKK